MRALLRWAKQKEPHTTTALLPTGYLPPLPASELLQPAPRQRLLQQIWTLTSLPHPLFRRLYLEPIQHYAALVQQLPASETHHHAYLGGMLDHGLELVAHALKLRQCHLLPPGSAPEDQARETDAWSAGLAYTALLHDIGKIIVDLQVEQLDGNTWHPWHGTLDQPYRFRYLKPRDYHLHSAATGLVMQQIIPAQTLDWLSDYPQLWASLLYVLAGHYERAGLLGELVIKADRISTAKNLGGNPSRAMEAPVESLQRQLLTGLRHLIKQDLHLNRPGAAGWLTEDSLWLVSKSVSDRLRAHLLSQGIEGVPTKNSALFNELQAHGLVEPTPEGKAIWHACIRDGDWQQAFTFLRIQPSLIWGEEERPTPFKGTVTLIVEGDDIPLKSTPEATTVKTDEPPAESGQLSTIPIPEDPAPAMGDAPEQQTPTPGNPGEAFLQWLKDGIRTHKLIINDTDAKVHTVAGTAFLVTPGIFHRYCAEHPGIAQGANGELDEWRWVQRRFEKLGMHRKTPEGLNIWTCQVEGPRKKARSVKGYVIDRAEAIFDAVPPDNPFLRLIGMEGSE